MESLQTKREAALRQLGKRHVLAKESTFPAKGWRAPISRLQVVRQMAQRAGRI